jgi:hypothetical protein
MTVSNVVVIVAAWLSFVRQSSCLAAPAGTFVNATGMANYILCPNGTYGPGNNTCIQCAPGFIANYRGATSCMACPAGTYESGTNLARNMSPRMLSMLACLHDFAQPFGCGRSSVVLELHGWEVHG